MFFLGRNSLANLEGVDPVLIKVCALALSFSKVDFGIPSTGGLRTLEQQQKLFKDKLSQLDGYHKRSRHQPDLEDHLGKAVDVFGYVRHKASYDMLDLTHIATAMFKAAAVYDVELIWGGHWTKFVDAPHFELVESKDNGIT
jgi:peptidoglycan L-alanyl-D-glutamate endopeptidase CwlK